MGLAVWRSITAQLQVGAAQRQAEIAQEDSADRQFQHGADMLGHERFYVRASGVRTLYDLASRHLDRYGTLTTKILDDFSVVQQNPNRAAASRGESKLGDGSTYEGTPDGAMAKDFAKKLQMAMPEQSLDTTIHKRCW